MKQPIQYSVFAGFAAASVVIISLQHFGVSQTSLTVALYFYAVVGGLGSVIGHRYATLVHEQDHENPSFSHVIGFGKDYSEEETWNAVVDGNTMQVEDISLHDNLVSLKKRTGRGITAVSYPQKIVDRVSRHD